MAVILDLLDTSIKLLYEDKAIHSNGFVFNNENEFIFGETAEKNYRTQPREVNNKFWWRLGMEPLQLSFGPARHTADLVHQHLLSLSQDASELNQIALAVSGSMSKEQLSLLLGIIEQCPFTALGIIHRSALLAANVSTHTSILHLELQLHQAMIVELERRDDSFSVTGSSVIPGMGWLQLKERYASVIAANFINQTRFDPRKQAHTDQLLYDQMPRIIDELFEHDEASCEIQGHVAQLCSADVQHITDELVVRVRGIHRDLDQRPVLLEPPTSTLPGINKIPKIISSDTLRPSLIESIKLDPNSLRLIKAVPTSPGPMKRTSKPIDEKITKKNRPTHWMDKTFTAYPLGDGIISDNIRLICIEEDWFAAPADQLTCNSNPVSKQALVPGDRLQFNDEVVVMIHLRSDS